MASYNMSILDYAFFLTDIPESPKHIGLLSIFSKPKDADEDIVKNIYDSWMQQDEVKKPFNLVLSQGLLHRPQWREVNHVDLSKHCFYHRLPDGSGRAEYYDAVCDIHKDLMDRSRPGWEIHFFDGIKGDRFGFYIRVHHALGDGQTAARWIFSQMAASPDVVDMPPIWNKEFEFGNQMPYDASLGRWLTGLSGKLKATVGSLYGLTRISAQLCVEALGLTSNNVAIPFTAKKSMLTGQVPSGREFATAAVPLDRVNRLRKTTRSTLNHVAVTCIDMAMNRYLNEVGVPLDGPLTILMPVSLRPEDAKQGGGNDIAVVPVTLSTNPADPIVSLRQVGVALQGVRNQVNKSPAPSMLAYTLCTVALPQAAEMAKLSGSLPPLGHTVVSNVPGPRAKLYLCGCEMEEPYPISNLSPGMFLNITILSYDDQLCFGLVAAKGTMPELSKLGSYIYEAFVELDEMVAEPDLGYQRVQVENKAED